MQGILLILPLSHAWGFHSVGFGLIAWEMYVKVEFHSPRGVHLERGAHVEPVAPLTTGIVLALPVVASPGLDSVLLLSPVSHRGLDDRETLDRNILYQTGI